MASSEVAFTGPESQVARTSTFDADQLFEGFCCNRHLRSAACLVAKLICSLRFRCCILVQRSEDWRWPSVNEYSGVSAAEQERRCRLTIDRANMPPIQEPESDRSRPLGIVKRKSRGRQMPDYSKKTSKRRSASKAEVRATRRRLDSCLRGAGRAGPTPEQAATRHGRCIWLRVDRGPGTRRSRRQKRARGWRRPFFQVCAHSAAPSDAELCFLLSCLRTAVPSHPDACILQRLARRSGEMPSDAAGVSG
jgi:hypothetical protein